MRKIRNRRTVKRRKEESSPFHSGKEKASKNASSGAFFQAKLEIKGASDPSEREADAVAASVTRQVAQQPKQGQTPGHSVQRKGEEKKEEPAAKLISRKGEEKKEEPKAKLINRKGEEKKEEPVAKKGEEKKEEPAAKLINRKGAPKLEDKKEEPAAKLISRKGEEKKEESAAKLISRKGEKEEEPKAKLMPGQAANLAGSIQMKSKGSKSGKVNPKAKLEGMINDTKGAGMALPDDIRAQLEAKYKADFSKVRIHTGIKAIKMTSIINAQAFTHGYDIYFNAGKYQPNTSEGMFLLAHELTHVVQQKQ